MSKRIDTSRSSGTCQGAAGAGSGHFQDTDPVGSTQMDALWHEGMQEDVLGTIEGLGGTLTGDETAQLWGLLGPRVKGQVSHATDTGSTSTQEFRLVSASVTSRANALCSHVTASIDSNATGVRSHVAASSGSSATGPQTHVSASVDSVADGEQSLVAASNGCQTDESAVDSFTLGCLNSKAYYLRAGAIASQGCLVGQDGYPCSVVVASQYTECVRALVLALGYSASPISRTGADQNLTALIEAMTGHIKSVGSVYAKGAVKSGCADIDGASPLASLNADGTITATGTVGTPGLVMPTGGAALTCGTDLQSSAQAAGDSYEIIIYTTAATAGCLPMANIVAFTGGSPRIINTVVVAGTSVKFTVKNIHPTDASDEIRVNWWLLNPGA